MSKRKRKRRDREPAGDHFEPAYPVVTIAQYGPNDHTVTKITAGIISGAQTSVGELKRWVATDVVTSPGVHRELIEFIEQHGAQTIIFTAGIIGCVHEEGKDYPSGEECPFCPFWHGVDRWENVQPIILEPRQFRDPAQWLGR